MHDPNLPMLEDAARKLAPFLDEIVFVGGVTLGLLITDAAAAPIRATTDVDVIAEIVTYADYIVLSERLRRAHFTEDTGVTCRWHNGALTLDVLALSKEVLGFTNIWYESALRHASTFTLPAGNRSASLLRLFSWERKWKHFAEEARWTFRPATILKTLLQSLKEGTRYCKRSPLATGSSGLSCRRAKALLAESRFLDVLPGFVLDSERFHSSVMRRRWPIFRAAA